MQSDAINEATNKSDVSLWRMLCYAAIAAFFIHLVAGISMAFVLAHGLDSEPDFRTRVAFLVTHRFEWVLGWLPWNAAALAILGFYAAFARAHSRSAGCSKPMMRFAVYLTVAAIAADLSAQSIEMGVLPDIAQRFLTDSSSAAAYDESLFVSLRRLVVMMTGCMANGLYTLSAALLIWSTRRQYKPIVVAVGAVVVIAGAMLSLSALFDSVEGLIVSNLILMPTILGWFALVGRDSAVRANLLNK